MAETWTPVGKVTPTPKGAWSSSTSYARLDIVSNNGASYIAIQGVPAGTAITNTSYWQKFADKGDTGATGATGNGVASIVVTEISTSGSAHNYRMAITMTNGNVTNVDYTVTDGAVTSVNGRTGAVTGLAEEEDLIKAFPNDTASGDIASFPDGAEMPVKDMKINVEPYQNLNGYEYPWVGGAGKNKIDDAEFRKYSNWSADEFSGDYASDLSNRTFKLPTTNGVQYTLSFGVTSSVFPSYISLCSASGSASQLVARYTTDVFQRTYYTFTATSDTYYIRMGSLTSETSFNNQIGKISYIQLEESASATSYAPYSNICPIYPANGKNLIPSNLTFKDGYIRGDDGTETTSSFSHYSSSIAVSPSTAYTISNITGSGTGARIYFLQADGTWISRTEQYVYDGFVTAYTFTTPSNCGQIQIQCGNAIDMTKVQLEVGKYETPYVPYRAFGSTRVGKNLLNMADLAVSASKTVNADGSVTVVNGGSAVTSTVMLTGKLPKGTYTAVNYNTDYPAYIQMRTGDYSHVVDKNGTPCTFTYDGVSYLRLLNSNLPANATTTFKAQIELGSTATSYEPYTGERYYSRDYNMWDEEWEVGNIDNTTGQNAVSANCIRSKNYIPVEPNTKYYTNGFITGNTGIYEIYFYGSDKTFLHEMANTNSFTTSANAHFMRFRCSNAYGTTYKNDIIFNYSNPSQVGYGGVLDVDTGLLTVTHNAVDMGTLTWTQASTNTQGVYRQTSTSIQNLIKRPSSSSQKVDIICSNYKTVAGDEVYLRYHGICVTTTGGVGVYDEKYSADGSSSAFKTSVEGATLVYPLATSVQYQLTPTQVKTLLGYNNIWTDSGTVEVNYLADTSLYIQKLTGSTEEDMIANANIENGKYFMVGNELFLSTSAIAQGASIVVGTNCIRTNLADALNALNS